MNAIVKTSLASLDEAERLAKQVRVMVNGRREAIWNSGHAADPISMLDPSIALTQLGYRVQTVSALGVNARGEEVAGLIDQPARCVLLSRQYNELIIRYTGAHELGHAVWHPGEMVLHRDRPLDGPAPRRELVERQADEFASCFLMPPHGVAKWFEDTFGKAPFVLNDDTLFGLIGPANELAWRKLSVPRNLSLALARANNYFGDAMLPLHQRFKVSATAMAIRLEQLDLVPTTER